MESVSNVVLSDFIKNKLRLKELLKEEAQIQARLIELVDKIKKLKIGGFSVIVDYEGKKYLITKQLYIGKTNAYEVIIKQVDTLDSLADSIVCDKIKGEAHKGILSEDFLKYALMSLSLYLITYYRIC